MWCATCQADVAGEVSVDARSLLCTTCGSEVSSIRAPGKVPETRVARELLDRWNTEELLDPYQPGARSTLPELTTDPPTGAGASSTERLAPRRTVRLDSSHTERSDADSKSPKPTAPASGDLFTPQTPKEAEAVRSRDAGTERSPQGPPNSRPRVARRPAQRQFRVDARHASQADGSAVEPFVHGASSAGGGSHRPHAPRDVPAAHGSRIDASHEVTPPPHFNIDSAFHRHRHPGRGESLWGQLLAYAGVGVLTVGTGLVVWGYFGGPDSYTPTGWLLATAGQMLLFLGIVTLISGGMEQTTHEVTQRIEHLGDHILRIERHAEQALRGPHFAAAADAAREPSSVRIDESAQP